jgi:hypothetical protein
MFEANPKPATGCEGRLEMRRNPPHENANERREYSVQMWNCPTQAKTGLEMGHPPLETKKSRLFSQSAL